MRMTRVALVLAVLAAGLGIVGAVGSARTRLLHPVWHIVRQVPGYSFQGDDGRFQFWSGTTNRGRLALVEDRSGRRRYVSRAGCSWFLAHPDRNREVLFVCGSSTRPALRLYLPETSRWTRVRVPSKVENYCADQGGDAKPGGQCQVFPEAFGTRWLAWQLEGTTEPGRTVWQNLRPGALRSTQPAPTSSQSTDLNSPTMLSKVRVPPGNPTVRNPSTHRRQIEGLDFIGGFAIATEWSGNRAKLYLERCGSRKAKFFDAGSGFPDQSQHLIVWQTTAGRLEAIELPSERRISLTLPPAARGIWQDGAFFVAMSPSRIYVFTDRETWVAPIPSADHRG